MLSCMINPHVYAQCDLAQGVPIIDNDTTLISFQIQGASNNNLASGGQGVCGVSITFAHDFVGDVALTLISPSGQEVQLVGPSVQTSPNTQFITWDVTFVPCSAAANPDAGLFPDWDNLGNWFQFNTYTGSYYPSNGCLEDFDTGPVNGNWSLRVSDALEFGAGMIEDFQIFFCDPSGINCDNCIAEAGSFTDENVSFCEGQEELLFTPEVQFASGGLDPDYALRYLLFSQTDMIGVLDNVDLRNQPPGNYQVCGLTFLAGQESSLPTSAGVTSKQQYEDLLLSGSGCHALSLNDLTITIEDVLDTTLIERNLCAGDDVMIDDIVYDEPGRYILGYSEGSCDSMTILALRIFNLQADISGDCLLYTSPSPRD